MSDENNPRALAIIPRTVAECTDLAERLAKSGLLPEKLRGKVPDVLMTIMAGQEMGLAPMAALKAFHIIEGKPVMSADCMVGLVLASRKAVYFRCLKSSAESVIYETLRVGDDMIQRCEWTWEMAKKAALTSKDNWRLYPRAMLASRARSELARAVYPDVLAGVYTEDEITVTGQAVYTSPVASSQQVDVIDAEMFEPTKTEPSLLDDIDAAKTRDELAAMVPRLQRLTGKDLQEARARYGAALARLPKPPAQPAPVAAAEPKEPISEWKAKALTAMMQATPPSLADLQDAVTAAADEPPQPTAAEWKEYHDSKEPEAIARRSARPDPFLEVLQSASAPAAGQQDDFRVAVLDPEIPA